jgi:hypothetical protein
MLRRIKYHINETYSLVSLFLFCILSPNQPLLQTSVNLNLTKLSTILPIRDYDIIAVQEVVAGYGVQAVARLSDELNRTGSKWDYIISDPTSSSPYKTERYAFIWKTTNLNKARHGKKKYHSEIESPI